MFLTLGLAGTFVAVIGLYGVRSYLVSRRIRAFGVRMAIGASPADVLRLVVRESLAITTSVAASIIPARRAAHVLPMTALRNG